MAVTTELVLVRHGEANNNRAGIVGGELGCTGLSQHGHDQVRKLASRLGAEHQQRPFTAFYGSPRRRVQDTIDILKAKVPIEVAVLEELRGPDHGDADGRSWQEVKTAFGGPPQHRPDTPYANGSETWNGYLNRATATLRGILHRHTSERILIAAHGETVEAAHGFFLQIPESARLGIGFVTDHASITRWQLHINRFERHVWMLVAHNDTQHLTCETS